MNKVDEFYHRLIDDILRLSDDEVSAAVRAVWSEQDIEAIQARMRAIAENAITRTQEPEQ